MGRRRMPCRQCGGPKGPGRARHLCDGCAAAKLVWCSACREFKDRAEFYSAPSRSTGATTYCKRCAVDRNRDARYGLPYGTLQRMYAEQDGRCAICSDPMTIDEANIDHDHACCPGRARSCGKCVRSLLCRQCNHGLGNFDDDPDRLLAAADYVLRFQDVLAAVGGESDRPR